jgi:RNA polymerase-binding transcription factor DksA
VATFTDNLSLEHTLEATLNDVNRALVRIAKGTYGKCKYCGQEIDERRLKARPESGSCVKCKQERLNRA